MVSKAILFACAQALLAQGDFETLIYILTAATVPAPAVCVFGQAGYSLVSSSPSLSGNSLVDNNIVVNSGGCSLGNVGLAASGLTSSGLAASGLAAGGLASGAANGGILSTIGGPGYINLGSISGGGVLPVTSYSSIVPAGLTVLSDNVIEGALLVSGELPFLSAVAFEGGLATGGSGAASCGCGDGSIGIVSENTGSGLRLGPGSGLGYGAGLGVNNLGGLRGLSQGGLVL